MILSCGNPRRSSTAVDFRYMIIICGTIKLLHRLLSLPMVISGSPAMRSSHRHPPPRRPPASNAPHGCSQAHVMADGLPATAGTTGHPLAGAARTRSWATGTARVRPPIRRGWGADRSGRPYEPIRGSEVGGGGVGHVAKASCSARHAQAAPGRVLGHTDTTHPVSVRSAALPGTTWTRLPDRTPASETRVARPATGETASRGWGARLSPAP